MSRQSTINRLPKEVQREINSLFEQGFTVTQVTEHLKALGAEVSRSAIGRKRQEWAEISRQVRESRLWAETIAREYRNAPASEVAAANVELLHALMSKILRSAVLEEEVKLKPSEVMQLSKALSSLTGARKQEVETTVTAEKAAQESAVQTDGGADSGVIEIKVVETEATKTPQAEKKA
jgi:hypothetical protein